MITEMVMKAATVETHDSMSNENREQTSVGKRGRRLGELKNWSTVVGDDSSKSILTVSWD